MRILIGNDFDDSVATKGDVRAWTQRILWLARDGDAIILMSEPDRGFLGYVASFTGVEVDSLRFHTLTGGRFNPGPRGQYMFDAQRLLDADLLTAVSRYADEVDEIFALWPAAHVATFAGALGLADKLPGAGFIQQNGGELANNKGNFRAFAAAAGIPVTEGAVCRTIDDSILHSHRLLASNPTIVAKRAHSGAGAGNIIVTRDAGLVADHSGGKLLEIVDPATDALDRFWRDRWDWLSVDGRYPVVVEAYLPDARSIYAEFRCADTGVRLLECGELLFEGRALTMDVVPLAEADRTAYAHVVTAAQKLADFYRGFGYRGLMCADAVLRADGRFAFTEVNARASSSTHVYSAIGHRLVRTSTTPTRRVTQYTTPSWWAVHDFAAFLHRLDGLGLGYDRANRTGVLCTVPMVAEFGRGQVVLALVHESDAHRDAMLDALDTAFNTASRAVAARS